jgi:hypothetical protein
METLISKAWRKKEERTAISRNRARALIGKLDNSLPRCGAIDRYRSVISESRVKSCGKGRKPCHCLFPCLWWTVISSKVNISKDGAPQWLSYITRHGAKWKPSPVKTKRDLQRYSQYSCREIPQNIQFVIRSNLSTMKHWKAINVTTSTWARLKDEPIMMTISHLAKTTREIVEHACT